MHVIEGVNPVAQASVNTNTLVAGSILNAQQALSVSFTNTNSGAESIDWEVIAGNTSDLSDAVVVQASATILSSAVASYAVNVAPFEFYGIKIASTVGGSHGEATVRGTAKG